MSPPRSLRAIRAALQSGALTLPTLVDQYLERARATAGLNAYVGLFEAEARRRAAELQQRYAENPDRVGPLFGMVVSIKDVLCRQGEEVSAGSRMLEGFRSPYTATAVARLLAADAILIGRTNCDEFAMGSTNETSYFGPVRHPIDPDRVPGGSSGGAAVAVATDTCLASIGTDTGGSVRQPAAYCGVLGLKPSYGRISRHGLIAYASSFDQIGILAHSVEDAALLLEVMAGPDEYDATVSRRPVPAYSQELGSWASPGPDAATASRPESRPARIAYFPETLDHPGLHPEIAAAARAALRRLRTLGHTVDAASFPYLDHIIPAYYVLTTAEASSNLSRYDGIRYGYRSPGAGDLLATYRRSRTEGFGREVKRRIMLGTFVLSAGYYDAYYGQAQRVRRLIRDATETLLKTYDFLFLPTAPVPPQRLGESLDDPVAMYLADIFTVQANMAGVPAISLPAGRHANGLPIGMQLVAGRFQEASLLAFAQHILPYLSGD